MNDRQSVGALAPYRVLDLTSDLGSLCGRMLADLGADVIKVEPPGGDPARLVGPFYGGVPDPARSLNWLYFNAGERGISLDWSRTAGQLLLRRLVAVSDFVVESGPPGDLESRGLGYDTLAARTRTGLGRQVDVSAQESVVWTLMIAAQTWDISRINPRRDGSVRELRRPNGVSVRQRVIWPCRDGFVYWTLGGGNQAGAFASMCGLVSWLEEEDCAGELSGIDWGGQSPAAMDQERYDRITAPVARFLLSRTKRELFEGAVARSIQLAPADTLADLPESRQLAAREYFVAVHHPRLALTLQFPGAPVRLSKTPWRIARSAPALGEHNEAVYGDLLGLDGKELARLK